MTTRTDFELRPLTPTVTSGKFNTEVLDAEGTQGVNFEIQVSAIAGTSAELQFYVQSSVDGCAWTDAEGEVSATTPAVLRIFRLGIQRYVRLRGELLGTTPSATYAIMGNWVGDQVYPTITAAFDEEPLIQGDMADISGTTGVAGALVHYLLQFDFGDSVEGDLTADRNGNWSVSGLEVPVSATTATLDVDALGQTIQVETTVEPPPLP